MWEGSAFERLHDAIDDLEAVSRALDPARLDGPTAASLVEVAARGERICAAIKAFGARRVQETDVWRKGSHRGAAHWVAEATGETVGPPDGHWRRRALDHLPDAGAAFRTGELSPTQAAEIANAAGADPAAETELLEAARSTSVKGLRDRCREVRAGAEADDAAWARRLHCGGRAYEWTDPDGMYRLEARLAPDAGARLSSAWRAHTDRIFRDARRAGRREPRAAYAADALVALAAEGPCKPVQVSAVVDSAALARGHTEPGEGCEINGVGSVPVTTAPALMDDAVGVRARPGRRRHHGGVVTEARDPAQAAPGTRSPLPPHAPSRRVPTTSSSRSITSCRSRTTAPPRSRTSGGSAPTITR
ncbi:MAG TPA: hypothetical protein VKH36_03075 [Acidimicrobiia bacterium]|nr:hypothetical protein [Acidimicrobiia bacterium]